MNLDLEMTTESQQGPGHIDDHRLHRKGRLNRFLLLSLMAHTILAAGVIVQRQFSEPSPLPEGESLQIDVSSDYGQPKEALQNQAQTPPQSQLAEKQVTAKVPTKPEPSRPLERPAEPKTEAPIAQKQMPEPQLAVALNDQDVNDQEVNDQEPVLQEQIVEEQTIATTETPPSEPQNTAKTQPDPQADSGQALKNKLAEVEDTLTQQTAEAEKLFDDSAATLTADATARQEGTQSPGGAVTPSETTSLGHSGQEVRSLDQLRQMPGNPRPQYELEERLKGHQGAVIFRAYVTTEGQLQEFKLVQSSGHRNLDGKTLKALKQWRFFPGQAGWVELPFDWNLKGGPQEMPAFLRRKVGQRR
jgi:TonB family protein